MGRRTEGRSAVLLIERLDLFTMPVWLWLAWRHGGGYYVGSARTLQPRWLRRLLTRLAGLRQLGYQDFPGIYFEVQRLVPESVNDAVYDAARDGEAAPVIRLLRRFHDHELMEVALRRALEDAYTLGRVKAVAMLRELWRGGAPVVFVPRDDRDLRPHLPPSLREALDGVRVPAAVRVANRLKAWLEPLAALPYAFALAAGLVLERGMTVRTPAARSWRVSFDTLEEGINWSKPYMDRFLFDDRELRPQTLLHVVRRRLTDEQTRQYFQENGIPFVATHRVPVSLAYLGRRVARDFALGMARLALARVGRREGAPFVWAVGSVLLNLMRAEVLELAHRPQVFVGRDEYSVGHILRTLLYELRGGRTIGYSHGDDPQPSVANSYQTCHVFCFPGPFHQELLKWNTRFSRSTCVIGAGLYGLDETYRHLQTGQVPAPYAELQRQYRIVGGFGSTFQEDLFLTRELTLRFYRTLLAIPARYPDVVLVLRPKGDEFRDPEFRDLVAAAGPRVILEEQVWTYELLPVFDLMICIASSSVGLDGLMAGRRVIYFDETRFADHPYARYGAQLVTCSPEELHAAVGRVLDRGEYLDPATLDFIRTHHGLAFDGQVVERFRDVVYEALERR